jgi:Ca2+-transporting ATPase
MTCRIAYTPSFPKWAFAFKGVGYSAKNSAVVKLNGPVSHLSTIDDNIHPSVAYGSSEYDALQALLEAACLCNNASFSETDEEVLLSGQPTEIALLVGAKKMGTTDPRPLYYRLQEIPFTSDRKRMEVRSRPVSNNHSCNAFTLCQQLNSPEHAPTDNSLYFVKGMPEAVIGECVYFTSTDVSLASMSDGARAHALSQSRQMASLGLRVLAIAYGEESLYFYLSQLLYIIYLFTNIVSFFFYTRDRNQFKTINVCRPIGNGGSSSSRRQKSCTTAKTNRCNSRYGHRRLQGDCTVNC